MSDVESKIRELLQNNEVVVFMKGNRQFPQCGFSGAMVATLNEFIPKYETVNVLADPEMRDAIKTFSNWPTIPQLYIKGEFIGGSDIVREMVESGELQAKLGITIAKSEIHVTDAAKNAFVAARESEEDFPRVQIDANFQVELFLDKREPGDVEIIANSLTFLLDSASARRANGMSIDFVKEGGGGFKIENPNAPARVKSISAAELKALLDKKEAVELFDVRTVQERAIATIPSAIHLDAAGAARLEALPKTARIVFHCHHGMRSRAAAEEAIRRGFKNVWNLEGGIDAWSAIDPSVSKY